MAKGSLRIKPGTAHIIFHAPLDPSRLCHARRTDAGGARSHRLRAAGVDAELIPPPSRSDLRIKIEKRIQALLELGLDLLPRALQQVHGHVRFVAILQLQRRVANLVRPRPPATAAFRTQESNSPCPTSLHSGGC